MPRVYFSLHICYYLHWLLQLLARFKNYQGSYIPVFTPLAPAATTHLQPGQKSFSASKRLMVHPETEHEGQKANDEAKSSTRGQLHSVSKGSCDKMNVQQ